LPPSQLGYTKHHQVHYSAILERALGMSKGTSRLNLWVLGLHNVTRCFGFNDIGPLGDSILAGHHPRISENLLIADRQYWKNVYELSTRVTCDILPFCKKEKRKKGNLEAG